MQHNLENSTDNTDWRTNGKQSHTAGSTFGKLGGFGSRVTSGAHRDIEHGEHGGRSRSNSVDRGELSAEDFGKSEGTEVKIVSRQEIKKENTRTMKTMARRSVHLGIDSVSMGSQRQQDALIKAGGVHKPSTTRNSLR